MTTYTSNPQQPIVVEKHLCMWIDMQVNYNGTPTRIFISVNGKRITTLQLNNNNLGNQSVTCCIPHLNAGDKVSFSILGNLSSYNLLQIATVEYVK